ncbi:conserved protein of unknown function (plasmid) [Rhodovastum atsumiense]|uniref:Uncharacterized protein n=1 Tax=Rhodovastum atsumiense TaxID=504468 RepID=A0A5M6IMU4_9PROT|nr:hypothetical protein [Rhodovastum atsumiense]KAA5609571.1 hypothetical protein F1189_23390 [Rhodovastum atsumiense]CAH2606402.1 conserved protein of unknown function [Rhodovastum atsumiense]
MQNPLKIAPPPPRRTPVSEPAADVAAPPAPVAPAAPPPKFAQVKEDERVQFNKRVTRRVADGFEMLAIRSRKRVPELLAEALELLEERYGKV